MSFTTSRDTCRGCGSSRLTRILSLGDMPLAGGFLREEDIADEQKIPLDVFFCEECHLTQICTIVDPEKLFKNYFYISSVIPSLSRHFAEYADFLKTNYLTRKNSTLLEMGCNDGVLLQYFREGAIKAVGIDPSENVCAMACKKGLIVLNDFFRPKSAITLREEHGKFDVITGSNMFAHIDNIIEIIDGVKIALKGDGVFIFEVHYLLDLIKDFQYDTIYHEHLTYYSVIAAQEIFARQGMRVIDVIHLDMHGGGIRVVTARVDSRHTVSPSVQEFVDREQAFGLDRVETFLDFGKKATEPRDQLIALLQDLKSKGKKIIGYGAP